MATNYPSGLDAWTNPAAGDGLASPSHAAQHANVNDAVEAVQAELGTLPKGSAASVKARLEGVENGSRLTLTSLLTTKGDLVARDASTAVRLPVGADGTVLQADAGSAAGVRWSPTKALSGTGAPAGVITAAPGSTFLQTDSTTDVKGWIKWVKASGTGNTGWVVGPEADTGWRLVSSWGTDGVITSSGVALNNITASASTAGFVKTRRIGARVRWMIAGAVCASGASLSSVATGFTQGGGVYMSVPGGRSSNNPIAVTVGWGSFFLPVHTADATYATHWEVPVDGTAWPASLPGSAA